MTVASRPSPVSSADADASYDGVEGAAAGCEDALAGAASAEGVDWAGAWRWERGSQYGAAT